MNYKYLFQTRQILPNAKLRALSCLRSRCRSPCALNLKSVDGCYPWLVYYICISFCTRVHYFMFIFTYIAFIFVYIDIQSILAWISILSRDMCWYCASHLPSTTTPLTPIFPLLTCCTSHLKLRRSSKLHLPGRRRRYSSLARNPSVRPSGLTPLALWCSERPWIKGWKKVNHPRKLESSLQSQGFQYLRSARRGGFVLPCKNQITDWHLDNGTKWWLDYLPSQRWHVFAHEFDTGFLGASGGLFQYVSSISRSSTKFSCRGAGHGSTVSLWCSWAEMELGAAGKESYRGREPPVFHNGGPVQHFTKTP